MTGRPLPLPDPPLADPGTGVVLRPWRDAPGDVAALVAAWADPAVAGTSAVPADRSPAGAARWIAGADGRREAGLALDLVVADAADDATVLGEVGLRNVDRVRRRGELGWWTVADHRGRGVASAAVGLLAAWALSPPCRLAQVWARIGPGSPASAVVARRAGLRRLGSAAGTEVWARMH